MGDCVRIEEYRRTCANCYWHDAAMPFSGSLNGQNYQISVLDNAETHCQLVSIVAQNEIATSFLDYAVLFLSGKLLGTQNIITVASVSAILSHMA